MRKTYVNTTKWLAKSQAVRKAFYVGGKSAVDFGMDSLMKETVKNVSGPHYGTKNGRPVRGPMTGRMPIPRITGALSRSVTQVRINHFLGAVFADKRKAAHAEPVHNLRKNPRPFLGRAVRDIREAVYNRMRYAVILAIRKVGR
jgi:hypothetical protein